MQLYKHEAMKACDIETAILDSWWHLLPKSVQ